MTAESSFVSTSNRAVARVAPQVPARIWAFEATPIQVALTNLALPALAQEATRGTIEGTVDLCQPGGVVIRRLSTLPVPQTIGVGAGRTMDLHLEIKALAGDYELRFGLQQTMPGGATTPLPIESPPQPVKVANTIFDAFVELVNACNFRCTFCPQGELQRPQKPMEFDLAMKVVRDLADMGHHYPIRVHLLGEPLLYKRFFDFVDATHGLGQRVLLATNGSRFQPATVEGIFRTGLDEMVISLNTPEKELYDAQRGTTMPFEEYMAGIENMITELVRRRPPPRTRINVLYDITKYRDPVQLAKVRAVANHWIDLVRRVSGRDLPPAQEVIDLTPGATTLMPLSEGLELQWTSYHSWGETGKPEGFCSFPWRQLAVLVDGQATACCVDAEGEINLGDATKQSIAEIWNGPRLQALRADFLSQKPRHKRCIRCDTRHHKQEFFPDHVAAAPAARPS